MPELSSIDHLQLTVRNLDTSIRWYKEVLGFEVVSRTSESHLQIAVLGHEAAGISLALCHHDGGTQARFDDLRVGLDHVSFAVPSRNALAEWKAQLELLHVDHSDIKETGTSAVLVLRDPDHIQLELIYRSS